MYDIFSQFERNADTRIAKLAASDAQASAETARNTVVRLEDRIDRLVLICQAMWSLLQECSDLTEAHLAERITEIDQRDGALDGKMAKRIVKCKKCDSAICHRFGKCMFCGEPAPPDELLSFERV